MSDPKFLATPNKPSVLESRVEHCAQEKTLEAINCIPNTAPLVQQLLLKVYHEKTTEIQILYSKISESTDPDLSNLITSTILLRALFQISFTHPTVAVVKTLLSLSPQPSPNMRTFINNSDSTRAQALSLSDCKTAEIWTLMIKHGYKNADKDPSALEKDLNDIINRGDLDWLAAATVLGEYGANVQIHQVEYAMKHHSLLFENVIVKYANRQQLAERRWLNDAIAREDHSLIYWLIGVAQMDVNAIPSEGQRPEDFNPLWKPTPKGTALHEAVLHGHHWIVSCLLERGAKRWIRNQDGHTPFGIALGRRDWTTLALLVYPF